MDNRPVVLVPTATTSVMAWSSTSTLSKRASERRAILLSRTVGFVISFLERLDRLVRLLTPQCQSQAVTCHAKKNKRRRHSIRLQSIVDCRSKQHARVVILTNLFFELLLLLLVVPCSCRGESRESIIMPTVCRSHYYWQ